MSRYWRPAGAAPTRGSNAKMVPAPGAVIAWLATRKAWRVVRIDAVHQANWGPNTIAVWEKAGSPDPETWAGRERSVMVEPPRDPAANGKDRRGLRLCPWWDGEQWVPLMDPYPTCVECGGLWTCSCYDRNLEAAAAMRELDRLGSVLPGCAAPPPSGGTSGIGSAATRCAQVMTRRTPTTTTAPQASSTPLVRRSPRFCR